MHINHSRNDHSIESMKLLNFQSNKYILNLVTKISKLQSRVSTMGTGYPIIVPFSQNTRFSVRSVRTQFKMYFNVYQFDHLVGVEFVFHLKRTHHKIVIKNYFCRKSAYHSSSLFYYFYYVYMDGYYEVNSVRQTTLIWYTNNIS